MTDKKPTDWERIEADYRAGLLSVREIAAANGVSHTAIQKRAKADGWSRDLGAKIKARADALVAKREVATQVAAERVETDRGLIEANAEVIANVRLGHRKDISQARRLAVALLDELELETGSLEDLKELGELMAKPDDKGYDKLNELYHKVISLPGRTKTIKDLGDTLHKLITLEREAYGLQTGDPVGGGASAPQFIIMPVAPKA